MEGQGGGGGGESPNGVVIDPVWYGGAKGFYNRNAELNDVVCHLCGDGGLLLCCEGPCLRSYHATRVTGVLLVADHLGTPQNKYRLCGIFFARVAQTGNTGVTCAGHGDLQANSMLRCSDVITTPVAASTTLCASADGFTLVILQRQPDAESGLLQVGHFSAPDHIVRA